MLKHFFVLTLKGIKHRPTRSWLTILGIVISITLVVIIFALSGGIQGAVSRSLQMFGSDIISIYPGKETNPLIAFIGGEKFKVSDLMALEDIEGIKFVAPMEMSALTVEHKGEKKSVMLHAAPWEPIIETYEESQGVKLEQGRWPSNDDVNEVVLASNTGKTLFKNKIRLGDELIIKSKKVKVVGVVSEVGEPMSDNLIYISLDIYRNLTGFRGVAMSAFIKLLPGADMNLITKQIKHQLSKQETVRDFSVLTPDKADRIIGDVLSIVELSLIFIALISLVVGAVGILNAMYTSVLERTQQIGVFKAIGASNDTILSMFLIESGMIGLVGGFLGVLFGIGFAYVISIIASKFGVRGLFSYDSLDYFGFLAVLIVTFITGVVAGVLPAKQAASMEPADALRFQ